MATRKSKTSAAGKAKRRYWLVKSEPDAFSFDDLLRAKKQRTGWTGVRNYQARNLMRDDMKHDDGVLYYHSNAKPMAVVGLARVSKESHPDPTAFDPKDHYFDPKSDPEDPTWFMVEIEAVGAVEPPLTRDDLKADTSLTEMMLLQRGSRLSVQPVTKAEWSHILKRAGMKESW